MPPFTSRIRFKVAQLFVSTLAPLFAASAIAQSDAQSSSARASAEQVRMGDAIEPEHAAGDWMGLRTRWKNAGVDLQFGYLAEVADIASGGLRRGADYAHQIKLQADLDGMPLLGLQGASLHTALINREGRSASADRLGDDLFQVQEIYGATGGSVLHLSYVYAELGAGHGAFNAKAGRMSVGQDFADSPLYCQFLSLGLCPEPRALTLDPAFSTVPSATWAARVRVAADDVNLSLGVYQARPRFGGPSGFDWGLSHTTGAEIPAEIVWEPRFGEHALQGHYKVGAALDTSNSPHINAPSVRSSDRWLRWLLADQMLVRTGKGGTDGLMLLMGWSHSTEQISALSDFEFVGAAARGLVPGRPGDAFNLLFGRGRVSRALTTAQQAAFAIGQPLPTGFPSLPGSFGPAAVAPGVQRSHEFFELNYGAKLRTGITLTPDLQYLWRPGATRSVPDALVLGGRVEVNF